MHTHHIRWVHTGCDSDCYSASHISQHIIIQLCNVSIFFVNSDIKWNFLCESTDLAPASCSFLYCSQHVTLLNSVIALQLILYNYLCYFFIDLHAGWIKRKKIIIKQTHMLFLPPHLDYNQLISVCGRVGNGVVIYSFWKVEIWTLLFCVQNNKSTIVKWKLPPRQKQSHYTVEKTSTHSVVSTNSMLAQC